MAIFGGMKEWATVSQIFMFDIHSIYIINFVDLIFIITLKNVKMEVYMIFRVFRFSTFFNRVSIFYWVLFSILKRL